MSDSASNLIEYIDSGPIVSEEEAAGKVGKFLGVIAAIAIPFAAPAIFGAVAGSGVLGAGLASAASAGTIGSLTSIIGSAAVGGLMNAGLAYAQGARGAQVWTAGGMGALGAGLNQGLGGLGSIGGGGVGGGSKALMAGTGSKAADIAAGANAIGGVGPVSLSAAAPAASLGTAVATPATLGPAAQTSMSSTIMNGIRGIVGSVDEQTMRRMGAALVNAAVNGTNGGALNGLVAQQKAELDALAARDRAAYNQRIQTAQQILQDAEKMDPAWHARIAMADVAGMEANQFRQAMRNIATSGNGYLASGQQKAYERGASLHSARSKALAYNQKYGDAQVAQTQLKASAMAGFTPDAAGFNNWNAGLELEAANYDAQKRLREDTWGTLAGGLFEQDHDPATPRDPATPAPQEDNPLGGFGRGLTQPFGG